MTDTIASISAANPKPERIKWVPGFSIKMHGDFYYATVFLLREEGGELNKEGKRISGYGHGGALMSGLPPTPAQKANMKKRRDAIVEAGEDIRQRIRESLAKDNIVDKTGEFYERYIQNHFAILKQQLQKFIETNATQDPIRSRLLVDEAIMIGSEGRVSGKYPWTEPQFRFYVSLRNLIDAEHDRSITNKPKSRTLRGALRFTGIELTGRDFDLVRRRLTAIYQETHSAFDFPIQALIEEGIFWGSRGEYGRRPVKGPYGGWFDKSRRKKIQVQKFLRIYDMG